MNKMTTEQLSRTNSIVGIVGGALYLGFMGWQIASAIKQARAEKKAAAAKK